MLISEQKFYTERELLQLGYEALPTPPNDYSSAKYSRQRAGGKTYYKKKDNSAIDPSSSQDLSRYVGTYTSLGKTGKIILDGVTLRASLGPLNAALQYVDDDNFTFQTNLGSGKITFNKDSANKITGFDYKFGDYAGTAFKTDGSSNNNPPTPDNKKSDSTSNPKPTSTPPPQPAPAPPKTIDYKVKYPSTQNPTKPFNFRECDEDVYNWDYGCKNDKIGLMNKILFGRDYGKIYGDEMLAKLRNLAILGPNETKITEDIYNEVFKLGKERGYVKLQESIVKETVKNILKERLIKK